MFNSDETLWSRTYINQMNLVEHFFQETNNDERLLFRQNIFDYKIRDDNQYLSRASLVALDLTKICCRIDKDKMSNDHKFWVSCLHVYAFRFWWFQCSRHWVARKLSIIKVAMQLRRSLERFIECQNFFTFFTSETSEIKLIERQWIMSISVLSRIRRT